MRKVVLLKRIGMLGLFVLFLVFSFAPMPYAQTTQSKAKEALTSETPQESRTTDIKQGGLLLQQGKFNASLEEDYAHYSSNEMYIKGFAILPVLVVGEISVERIKKNIFTTNLSLKYGLLDDLQLEVNVPYVSGFERYSNPQAGTEKAWEETIQGGHIGDISAGIYYQALRESGSMPAIILGLSGKSRTGRDVFDLYYNAHHVPDKIATGSGFYSLKGTATFVTTSNPAVLFATFGYAYNFKRNDIDIHSGDESKSVDIDPGDTASLNVGVSYALSYKVSINFAYQDAYTMSSKENGSTVVNSSFSSAMLKFGTNWVYNKNLILSFNVGSGLTHESPDMTVAANISYKF